MHLLFVVVSFNFHISFEFQNGVLYRGVSPDVLMLDKTGHLQVGAIVCCIIHFVKLKYFYFVHDQWGNLSLHIKGSK